MGIAMFMVSHMASKEGQGLQEEALNHLGRLEAPLVPTFYESGIIDGGVGYYQLAQLENDQRILVFALNLEDLQLREYAGYGRRYARPGMLYGVNAYDKSVAPNDIYSDLVEHQAGLMRVMREEYTLVRTKKDTYQSPTVSYVLKHDGATAIQLQKSDSPAVTIEVSINSLHNKKLTPVSTEGDGNLYDRFQVSRMFLDTKNMESKEPIFQILNHYTAHLNKLVQGEEGMKGEGRKLGFWSHIQYYSRMYVTRLFNNIGMGIQKTLNEIEEKKPSTFVEGVERGLALLKLPTLIHEGGFELFSTLWDAFNFTPKDSKQKTPKLLKPFIAEDKSTTGLNPYLRRMDATATETLVPLTLDETNIVPQNATILPGSPFDIVKNRAPNIGALRAPLGTILHQYSDKTLLLMQANGVWLAICDDKLYVGYNENMNTKSKPYAPPILQAWLDNQQVICYTRKGHKVQAKVMKWEEAALALQEIISCGDGALLATHKPTHNHGPLIISAPAMPEMKYLDFSGALAAHDEKEAALTITKPGRHLPRIAHRRRIKNIPRHPLRVTHASPIPQSATSQIS